MNEYFLSKEKLNEIAVFNGFYNTDSFYRKDNLKFFKENILRNLLSLQPELTSITEKFLEKAPTARYINDVFAEYFADKINIKYFGDTLFSKHFAFHKNESRRMKCFKSIAEEYPDFLSLAHKHLLDKYTQDATIYDIYFQLLKKNKSHNLPKDEVLSNISKLETGYDIPFCKKKINAYLQNFPKDSLTFDKITEGMGDSIQKLGTLKSFWEEKLIEFPKDIQDKYLEKTKEINLFEEEKSFFYSIKINPQYIMEKTKISQSKADGFCSEFQMAFSSFICSKYADCSTTNGYQGRAVNLLFKSIEQRNETEEFFKTIASDLPTFVNEKFIKDNSSLRETFENYLSKTFLAVSLTKELSPKGDNKAMKRKI